MQSWLAFAYDALTNGPHPIFFFAIILLSLVCGGLAMGMGWQLISQTRTDLASAIPGLVFVIIGGGLIWISLRYGFEFLAVTPPRVSNSSLACNMAEARYGLIIDAGSSGSRMYIFCWKPSRANGIPWVKAAPGIEGEPPWEQEVEPGLSDYKANPQDVGKYLQPLIDYALKKIGNNPQTLTQTPLFLMATAGMRRLSESKLDSEQQQSNEVLKNVYEYLQSTRFRPVSSNIIQGWQEGLYGWIAVNYLLGFLDDGSPLPVTSPTMGALELGGSSMQITFVPPDASQQDLRRLEWGKTTYLIYSHSYSHLGQDDAFKKINSAACLPKGYEVTQADGLGLNVGTKGTGDYAVCQDAIRELLKKACTGEEAEKMAGKQCALKLCKEVEQCSSVKEGQPSGVFLAFSGYYFTHSFFKLGSSFSLKNLEKKGKAYCDIEWKTLTRVAEYGNVKETYLKRYCFNTAYITNLLQSGYGFPADTQQIIIADSLHSHKISWTLGAMLEKARGELARR